MRSVFATPFALCLAARILITVRVVLRLLLILIAATTVSILHAALQVAMRLLAHAAWLILMLRLSVLIGFMR